MDISKYKKLYLQEAGEHLSGIEQSLLSLEKESDGDTARAIVDNLFRHYHTLKGMSASMGYEPIQKFSHAQENLLSKVRSGEIPFSAEVSTTLFACLDCLKDFIDRVDNDQELDIPLAPFFDMISKAASATDDTPPADAEAAPETAEPPEAQVESAPATGPPAEARTETAGPSTNEPAAEAPAAAPAPDGAQPQQPVLRISNVMKVESTVFDTLLSGVGDLFMSLSTIKALDPGNAIALKDSLYDLGKSVNKLHNNILAARMLPIIDLTAGLPRIIRDISRASGKDVELRVDGAELSLDRAILENLGAPLVHIIKNAVDHCIEFPEERVRAGKKASGLISIKAFAKKEHIVVKVADDGRGMDPAAIRAKAVEMGMPRERAAAMSDREALMLVCMPGLTSAKKVTDTSGRGVGMDVVKDTIEGLGGNVDIESIPGKGTAITLELPRTTSIVRSLNVTVAGESFLVPISHITKVVEVEVCDGSEISFNGTMVPVFPLAEVLGLDNGSKPGGGPRTVLLAEDTPGEHGSEKRLMGLVADAFGDEVEAYVKPLAPPMSRLWGVSGITITGDGKPVFMLDIPQIVARAHAS